LKRMEDQRGAFFVFAAGYPDNMNSFLKMNPGLQSRFDRSFAFDDYSADELLRIAEMMLAKHDLYLSSDSREYLAEYIGYLHQFRDKYFGNARVIRKLTDDLMTQQNLRLAATEKDESAISDPTQIVLSDVEHFDIEKDKRSWGRVGIGFRSTSDG